MRVIPPPKELTAQIWLFTPQHVMQYVSVPLCAVLTVFCWTPFLSAGSTDAAPPSGQPITISLLVASFAAFVAAATFLWRVYQSWQAEGRRRQALANAVYHHVDKAIEILDDPSISAANSAAIADMQNDSKYTPYMLHSADDDLTYEHVIGVMEWLDYAGEKAVADYFYAQSALYSIAESFGSEYVRSWPTARKLKLFNLYVTQEQKTLTSAHGARAALKKMVRK